MAATSFILMTPNQSFQYSACKISESRNKDQKPLNCVTTLCLVNGSLSHHIDNSAHFCHLLTLVRSVQLPKITRAKFHTTSMSRFLITRARPLVRISVRSHSPSKLPRLVSKLPLLAAVRLLFSAPITRATWAPCRLRASRLSSRPGSLAPLTFSNYHA